MSSHRTLHNCAPPSIASNDGQKSHAEEQATISSYVKGEITKIPDHGMWVLELESSDATSFPFGGWDQDTRKGLKVARQRRQRRQRGVASSARSISAPSSAPFGQRWEESHADGPDGNILAQLDHPHYTSWNTRRLKTVVIDSPDEVDMLQNRVDQIMRPSVAKLHGLSQYHESDEAVALSLSNSIAARRKILNVIQQFQLQCKATSSQPGVSNQCHFNRQGAGYVRVLQEQLGPYGITLASLRHGLRRKLQAKRKIASKKLFSILYLRGRTTKGRFALSRRRKYKSESVVRSLRRQVQSKRRITLGHMCRLLRAIGVPSQEQAIDTLRNPAMLPSLQPSKPTMVGMTCALLGFSDNQTSDTHKQVKSQQPVEEMNVSTAHRFYIPRQTAQPFRPSPHVRAPHSTPVFSDPQLWGENINTSANTGPNSWANEQASEGPASSPSAHEDGPNSDAGPNRSDPLDDQGSQPPQHPNENKKEASDEEPSSDSEPEEAPKSEADEDSDMEEEEQHTPLTYQIPSEVLDNALQAPPQTRASYWSQKLYRGPEDEELLIHYCSNIEISERVAKHFLDEKVVGFDIEWKPFGSVDSIKENASLIQIASENRIALFHIARFPGKTSKQLLPPTLKAVLESPDTLKAGVAVKGDVSRLEKYLDLKICGVFELSRLYNLVEHYATDPKKVSNRLVSLAKQVQQHLLLPLYKGEPLADESRRLGSVRESDWSRPLDFEQIQYAAADAYAGFRLFDVLESKRKKLKPAPPIPLVCDYDNKVAPRTAPKSSRAKKTEAEIEKVVAEALSGLEADDAEEEAYETAAEELLEEEEEEHADSESASESSDEVEQDPDAEYIPERRGRLNLDQDSTDETALSKSPAHRIARVDFSRPTTLDPGYPKLPTVSTEGESSSDESEAFDPPRKARLQRRVGKGDTLETKPLSTKAEQSDDEFADPELEEALLAMELGKEPVEVARIPNVEEQPDADMLGPSMNVGTTRLHNEASNPISVEPTQNTNAPPLEFTPLIAADTDLHTPQYNLATKWAQSYLQDTIPSPSSTSLSRIRATVPPLRAYHLWHHQRVPLDAIGAHLREPPLAQSTVSSYIIQAISLEKLEYRDADLVALMSTLPANLRLGRYAWLSRKLGLVR
ncbi:hypothetical protein N0V90_003327 [Kalmusia sp. IMI 367209]|nr:hypothetical protein N0V90_003327 [Kalmusia sp. IMI 367209]